MSRLLICSSLVVLLAVAALAASSGVNHPASLGAQVPCATPWACHGDSDVDSSVYVTHNHTGSDNAVKGANDTWRITAKYRATDGSQTCPCDDVTYTATANVYPFNIWYRLGPNAYSAPFRGIDVSCVSGNTCTAPNYYKLHVNLDSSVSVECPGEGNVTYYLEQVLYTTMVVANATPCGADLSAIPLSQTWQTGDNGAFECNDSCPSGPSLQIVYQ